MVANTKILKAGETVAIETNTGIFAFEFLPGTFGFKLYEQKKFIDYAYDWRESNFSEAIESMMTSYQLVDFERCELEYALDEAIAAAATL